MRFGRGRQMTVGLSKTAIFGDLGDYFFGKHRDKTSNITWRYATWLRGVLKDVYLTAQEVWTAADDREGWRAQRSSVDYTFC